MINTNEALGKAVRPFMPTGQTGASRDAAKTYNNELGRNPLELTELWLL